jgi:hypothetical protein
MNDRNTNGSNFTHGTGRGNMDPRVSDDDPCAVRRRRRFATWIAVIFIIALLALVIGDAILRVD